MGFPHFSQLEYSDCGATCLKIILKYYNKSCSLDYLRDLCNTTRSGVTMSDLVVAAQKLHFETISVLCTTDWLIENAVLPCIVHWKQEHFVVLYKATKNYFYISDPAYGKIKLARRVFENWWKENSEKGIVLFLEPTESLKEIKLPSSGFGESFKRSLTYYREATQNQSRVFLGILLLVALGSLVMYVFPMTMQMIIDKGVGPKNVSVLWYALAFQLALVFGQMLFGWLQGWLRVRLSMNVSVRMITKLILKVVKLPVRFFDIKVPTDIFQRIDDQKHIEHFISEQLVQTFFSVIITICLCLRLFSYNLLIGLVFTALSIVSVLWIFLFFRLRRQLDYTNFRLNSENHNLVNEIIYGMVEIKINNAQDKKVGQWQELQKRIFSLKKKILNLGVYQSIGVQLLTQIKNVVITFLCALWVVNGELTLGTMLSIGYITGLLANPIDSLANFSHAAQEAQLAFSRLDEIRSRDDEVKPGQKVLSAGPYKRVTFNNVSFKYEGSINQNVIDDLCITFPVGKVTAIVGNSGSGKTTLLKLLLCFYNPQQGSILLDDLDFKSLNPESWRQNCGIVLQDGFIFSGTIAENISIGEEHPNVERLWEAARIACIDEFISMLPMKFNTKIGNTGIGISGGQRQRILIARAVYKNPNFIFFDEATSSLDANNERKIMENLAVFFKGKTVVVIAHRLSTVKNADQIIVLDGGRVSETGTHETLTRVKGKYYELVRNQLELGV
jgi:ATP-binding cassette, subfamily B, bacterial